MISNTETNGRRSLRIANSRPENLETASPFVALYQSRNGNDSRPSSEEQLYALRLLNDASKFANDCGQNVWEFAIELNELLDRGVSRSLLRWFVCRNLIEHRIESRTCGDTRRQFFEAHNLLFDAQSCFVLSSLGHEALASLVRKFESINPFDNRQESHMNNSPKEQPVWCSDTRVLKIGGQVVKHFKWPAPNQEILISAFAEMGWPEQIDDPLPQTEVCPKRRLHDTIKCLNRNQVNALIKFRGDGTGRAARWEFQVPKEETESNTQIPAQTEAIKPMITNDQESV